MNQFIEKLKIKTFLVSRKLKPLHLSFLDLYIVHFERFVEIHVMVKSYFPNVHILRRYISSSYFFCWVVVTTWLNIILMKKKYCWMLLQSTYIRRYLYTSTSSIREWKEQKERNRLIVNQTNDRLSEKKVIE